MTKTEARRQAFAARKAAHAAGQGAAAADHLRAALAPFAGAPLAGYMPIRTEIDPRAAMAAHEGPVAVPVIVAEGQPLVFHRWTPGCAMVAGPFGAHVPEIAEPVVPRVVIVPLVAFDRRGFRLGYGGGFYDRFLEKHPEVCRVAVGFSFQILPEVPTEPTDIRPQVIVTEENIYRDTQ